jgi:hypothetical protein
VSIAGFDRSWPIAALPVRGTQRPIAAIPINCPGSGKSRPSVRATKLRLTVDCGASLR